jgi:hypothetical protein
MKSIPKTVEVKNTGMCNERLNALLDGFLFLEMFEAKNVSKIANITKNAAI